MTGQVDAALGGFRNFELTQMRLERAEGRCLFVEEDGIPSYDALILLANPDRMDPDVMARFVGAMKRGANYVVNHPDEAFLHDAGLTREALPVSALAKDPGA